jgi:ParB family transcriptional regulator, chromosome partitioning protein
MSLKEKASKIRFGSLSGTVPSSASGGERDGGSGRPKTAPGMLVAQAVEQRSDLLRENETLKEQVLELREAGSQVVALREELRSWDGAKPARLIDPTLIVRSRWSNRDPRHFESAEFEALKQEIAGAGGNVQPIKVRPLARPGEDLELRFELIFGHRRHEACRQLGLPVLALVESVDEGALFAEMCRENRFREDLSPWEQGMTYRRALTEGLFPSNRKLAEAVGADLGNVGKALSLADLPVEVVNAFPSPLDLQYRWAKPLRDAWERDAGLVRQRAEEVAKVLPRLKAKAVFDRLTEIAGGDRSDRQVARNVEVVVSGQRVGHVSVTDLGAVTVAFEKDVVSSARVDDLVRVLSDFLSGGVGAGA